MTLIKSEHSKVVELETVGEPCVMEHTHLRMTDTRVSLLFTGMYYKWDTLLSLFLLLPRMHVQGVK